MVGETDKRIRIDLSAFKLHACLKHGRDFTLHFNTPSRRFYLSLIGFLVIRMKRAGRITPVGLQEHLDLLVLLNETVGESGGSSARERLLGRIYRKWKSALPDLENAPLFRVLGKTKASGAGLGKFPAFTEAELDHWANLFEYSGSEENVRLRFSLDRVGLGLDDVLISWEGWRDLEAWDGFMSGLRHTHPSQLEPGTPIGVQSPGPAPEPRWQPGPGGERPHYRRIVFAGTLLLVVAGAAVAVWRTSNRAPSGVGWTEARLHPLPDKPSLAVLPFANMTGDKDQEYFSDGLTEELITALAKIPDIFVISRSSTFTYKDAPVTVQQVAADLGVRHVLEGSVQRVGDRVRITAQLIDAVSGYHLWSESYDRDLKDIFALQDSITFEITRVLAVKLSATGEGSGLFARGTDNLEAYLKLLRGKSLMSRFSKESNMQAQLLAEEVIQLDPQYPSGYYILATTNMMDVWLGISRSPKESLTRAIEAARKAVSLDDDHAAAWALLGFLYVLVGEHEKGIAAGELAVEKAPSSAEAQTFMAQILNFSGKPEAAVAYNDKAFRLTPVGRPGPIYLHAAHTYRLLGRYEDSIEVSRELLSRTPNSVPARVQLVAAYQGWRLEDARAAARDVLRYNPKFSARRYATALRYKDPALSSAALDQMLEAGLPE